MRLPEVFHGGRRSHARRLELHPALPSPAPFVKPRRSTGTSFDYLLATAKVESDLNPNLTMRSSSATGLFQFIDQTWLATLKQGGPAFGYGGYANAISRTPSGRYAVADPAMRGEIMRLRKDPTANALMGGVFTQLNAVQLAKRIGRAPSEGELYIAHFFGPDAAAKAIKLAGNDPTANAAAIFPAAAAANRPIFYDRQGNARSIAGVYAELVRRYQVARITSPTSMQVAAAGSTPPRPPALIPVSATTESRLAPPLPTSATVALSALMFSSSPLPRASAFASDTAGVTSAYAAASPPARPPETGSVFRSLFHDEGRRGAVAPVVQRAVGWTNVRCERRVASRPRRHLAIRASPAAARPSTCSGMRRPTGARCSAARRDAWRVNNSAIFPKIYGERFIKPRALGCETSGASRRKPTQRGVGRSMIVRQFLHWVRTAPAAERADATTALARAYLYSDLSPDDRAAAEGALIMLLDDPSPLVRARARRGARVQRARAAGGDPGAGRRPARDRELGARTFAAAGRRRSGRCGRHRPPAGAGRHRQPRAVAERGLRRDRRGGIGRGLPGPDRECDRPRSRRSRSIASSPVSAISPPIREAMLARDDLPATTRQALVAKLSETLAGFVTAREWLDQDRARRIAKEACEKATVTLAAVSSDNEIRPLIRHLRESGQLTAGLVLRALLSGNVDMFEEALAELSGLSIARVSALVHDKSIAGFRALYDKAGLPASTYPAFREAIEAMREGGFVGDPGGATRLKRRMVERVLTGCADEELGDIEPLMTLLRRFAAEAAREEARMFCDELVADDAIEPQYGQHLVAA